MIRVSPYDNLDPMQRWSTTAAAIAAGNADPQGLVKFTIGPSDRVASAGSCFSARIADRLRVSKVNYLVTEPAPTWMSADVALAYGYMPFSARHGLIFTTLQLMQLFDRAFGSLEPVDDAWETEGGFIDPARPRISPEPFATLEELKTSGSQHLEAVRQLFETLDTFVFTLGLTEVWCDRRDGFAYPICPGIAGGTFDTTRHVFRNLGVSESREYLESFIAKLRAVNPKAKLILTVSPIPIGATIEQQHVVRATTYTKSVLRVVAEECSRAHEFVDYFASYEMVSQAFMAGDPFQGDRRHLKDDVPGLVVDRFCAHYLDGSQTETQSVAIPAQAQEARPCDEDIFAR